MGGFNFRVDMHFRWLGREYIVKESLPDRRLRILDIAFDESRAETHDDLVKALYAGELEFLGETRDTRIQREQAQRFVDDFTMLDDSDPRKLEARRRLAYVTAVADENLGRFCAETVNPIIDKVHAEINDKKPTPHWKTVVYVYRPAWERCNKDVRALGPEFHKQGNRSAKIVGEGNRKRKGDSYSAVEKLKAREVEDIIETEIERLLERGKKVSIAEVHESVQLAIVNENRPEASIDYLPIPSERAIHYVIDRLRPYDKDLLLYGKAYADKKYQSNGPSAEYTRPLERVEYDDTPTDLLVVDETTGLPLGRATETLGVDCYTGMPHGSHTGFDGPGYLAVARALLHGIQPKNYIRQLYPMVEGQWPVYGVPQEIGVDNGAGYISSDLADACSEIGTTIDYCPPRYPNGKPYIESLNANLAERLHRLDGTTFSNFLDKADYDPEKHAVISFNAWMEIKHVTLVDLIPRQRNRRRHNTPFKLWTLGVTNYPPALPRKLHDLRVLLGRIETRTITKYGIAFECLDYNSEELKFLRMDVGSMPIKFKYDPTDIGVIYVNDPRNDRYLTVPALDQRYAKGLSLWQHQVIKRYAREELNVNAEDTAALLRAKKTIQDIVNKQWVKSGKSDMKRRLARWVGIRQPDYHSVLKMRNETTGDVENTTSKLPTPPDATASTIPQLMKSNSESAGSSDFDEDVSAHDESPHNDPADDSDSPTVEIDTSAYKADKQKRNPKKQAASTSIHTHEDEPRFSAADDDNDDDVDTTGFKSSLAPRKENADHAST
jgi:putative transposase